MRDFAAQHRIFQFQLDPGRAGQGRLLSPTPWSWAAQHGPETQAEFLAPESAVAPEGKQLAPEQQLVASERPPEQ